MSLLEMLGLALFAAGLLAVALKFFGLLDWSWARALLPLLAALVFQMAVAVTAGIGDYLAYMQDLMRSFLSGGQ